VHEFPWQLLDAYYGIKSKIIETELLAEFQASTILKMKLGTNKLKETSPQTCNMKWCNYTMQLRFPMGFMKLLQGGVEKSGALPLQQTVQL
jgi:hypothetical protein